MQMRKIALLGLPKVWDEHASRRSYLLPHSPQRQRIRINVVNCNHRPSTTLHARFLNMCISSYTISCSHVKANLVGLGK